MTALTGARTAPSYLLDKVGELLHFIFAKHFLEDFQFLMKIRPTTCL